MDIVIKRANNSSLPQSGSRKIQSSPPFNKQWGEWGRVEAQNSEDNTVDVRFDSGVSLKRVPVASKEWVIFGEDVEKDYNSGERDLPPANARVFIVMPSCTYNDCFAAPFSGFITTDRNASSPFMDDGREKIKERITPGGWHITDDYATGSHKAVSPDKKTSLEIDYGTKEEPKEENPELHLNLFDDIKAGVAAGESVYIEAFEEVYLEHKKGDSCKINVYDTEIIIKNGEVKINSPKTTIEVDGDATLKTSGKTTIEAEGDALVKADGKATVESSADAMVKAGGNVKVEATGNIDAKGVNVKVEATGNADLKGVNVTVDATAFLTLKTGDAAALMPNIMPTCPFGIPHGGPSAGIVKLRGG